MKISPTQLVIGKHAVRRQHRHPLPHRQPFVVRWLIRRLYGLRGRSDGRRALPLVTHDGGQRTPALRRLGDEIVWEANDVLAHAVSKGAPTRVALAKLTAAGGEIDRETDRLQLMLARRDAVLAEGPHTERRLGEDGIPDFLVALRRQREHERRLRKAEKKVEGQRTLLSKLAAQEQALRAQLLEITRDTDAQVRLVGVERRARASMYLNGAVRTHRQKPLLMASLAELTPSVPEQSLESDIEGRS